MCSYPSFHIWMDTLFLDKVNFNSVKRFWAGEKKKKKGNWSWLTFILFNQVNITNQYNCKFNIYRKIHFFFFFANKVGNHIPLAIYNIHVKIHPTLKYNSLIYFDFKGLVYYGLP